MNITSDWDTSDAATKTIFGTLMASPAVAGAAAVNLSTHPTPAMVRAALVNAATLGVVVGQASAPDRLLHTSS